VRALAQRSADAAKEIKDLITNSTMQVDRGVSLVGETGRALTEIVGRVGDVTAVISQISKVAEQQAVDLEHVNATVNNMDKMTQQNAAMVEQSNAAARSLAEEADQLTGLVSDFEVARPHGHKPLRPTQAAARPAPRASQPAPRRHVPAPAPVRAPAARMPQTAGSLALKADFAADDWSEF